MFEFDFTFNDLFEYANNLSGQKGFSTSDNMILYPTEIASGFSKFYFLNEYISYQIVNYTSNTRMIFKRAPSKLNNTIINFRDFNFFCSEEKVNCSELIAYQNGIGSVQCKSSKLEETLIFEKGMDVKVILVFLKEGWIDNIILDKTNKSKFYNYLVSSDANIRKEFLNPEQKKLLKEILTKSTQTKLPNLYNDSRILGLLETFLSEVLEKDNNNLVAFSISKEDISKIKDTEKYIIENVDLNFPGVDFLAKKSFMSRTKFINLFNKLLGMSAYDFYQKERLNLAYNYILDGNCQISKIAEKIGYKSCNNFTIAFKKEFGCFPKSLINEMKNN